MIDRERKVDVNKMADADVENLSEQIGIRVREICDEAAAKVNALLAIYGIKPAKIAIKFDNLEPKNKKKPKAPSKRAKKTEQANLK